MMFALAARYEVPDAAVEAEALAKVWTAGDEYLMQARELLYLYSTSSRLTFIDVDSSTISCCHALVLMAYHGVVRGHITPFNRRVLGLLGLGRILVTE
jgi:hypothetical protein